MRCTKGIVAYRRAATAPSFTDPTDIADIRAWFDASDTSSITASGSDVTVWADKSGNGYDLDTLVGTGADNPTTGTRTLNSLNVVDFDGVNDTIGYVGELLETPETVFVVAKSDTTHVGDIISDVYHTSATDYVRLVDVNGSIRWAIRDDGGADDIQLNSSTSLASAGIVTITDSGNAGVLRMNGTQEAADAAYSSNEQNTRFSLGRLNRSGPIQPYNGIIAEVIIYARVLDSDEIATVESYLATKWGISI